MSEYPEKTTVSDVYNIVKEEAQKVMALAKPDWRSIDTFFKEVETALMFCTPEVTEVSSVFADFKYLRDEDVLSYIADICQNKGATVYGLGIALSDVKDLCHDPIHIDGYGNLATVTKNDIDCLSEDLLNTLADYLPTQPLDER